MSYKFDFDLIENIKHFICESWVILQRSHHDLMRALIDPKLYTENKILYLSRKENFENIKSELRRYLPNGDFDQLKIKKLPHDYLSIKKHGLLYLPHPYVVPGGRFNEMYGWDSFFIILGLLRCNNIKQAKMIVDNLIYQVRYYEKVLNTNRSYHLDRSQPPLLSQMVLSVFHVTQDTKWLNDLLAALEDYYQYWLTGPHLFSELGLSRYYSSNHQPAPEVYSELDLFKNDHYARVKEYYRAHRVQAYDVNEFYCFKENKLNKNFYQGDRSMRESGFDPSSRYGPFGVAVTDYAPVCLNSLLYQYEKDLAEIYQILGEKNLNQCWLKKADDRSKLINLYCWEQDLGYYFDYNVKRKRVRPYIYATTFYPLWAGIASKDQACRIVQNLPALESPGGLMTSAYFTGNQWDAPFGWAPLHYFAIKGLTNYGYHKVAKRLAYKFVKVINQEFKASGTIYEKYDLSKLTSNVKHTLKFGYVSNEIGFGWTNGVYLELLDFLIKK